MFRVRIDQTLAAPIDAVFARLADHASYGQYPGVSACEIIEHSPHTPNGVGTVRKVRLGAVTLWENITRFEPPTCMEYRIVRSRPLPLAHELGRIELRAHGGGTQVTWVSEGHVAIPLLGKALDRVVQRQAAQLFESALRTIERSTARAR